MNDLMISIRKIKKKKTGKVWNNDDTAPGSSQFLSMSNSSQCNPEDALSRKDWLTTVTQHCEQSSAPILCYIHGYQPDAGNALRTQRQLRQQLEKIGFDGLLIGFDWASPAVAVADWDDRDNAHDSARRLRDDCINVLCSQQDRDCATDVHVLAHGSGAWLLREAMTLADQKRSLKNRYWCVNQIAFIGADVSSRSLRSDNPKSRSLYRHCHGLTNYQNPGDDTLSLAHSKHAPLSERAGRVGLPRHERQHQSINVNCLDQYNIIAEENDESSKTQTGHFAHDWYLQNPVFLQDLLHCLNGRIDRHYIPTRHLINGELCLYNPESILVLEDN